MEFFKQFSASLGQIRVCQTCQSARVAQESLSDITLNLPTRFTPITDLHAVVTERCERLLLATPSLFECFISIRRVYAVGCWGSRCLFAHLSGLSVWTAIVTMAARMPLASRCVYGAKRTSRPSPMCSWLRRLPLRWSVNDDVARLICVA